MVIKMIFLPCCSNKSGGAFVSCGMDDTNHKAAPSSIDESIPTPEDKSAFGDFNRVVVGDAIKIAYIQGIRLATGHAMMDIKKALEMCEDDLSKENFYKQMGIIHRNLF